MTRFARAKGSKASNERVEEEATSWVDIKKQLEQKQQEAEQEKVREKIVAEREENYQKFLKETEDKQETSWAEFPAATITSKVEKKKKNEEGNEKKKKNEEGNEKKRKKKKLIENCTEEAAEEGIVKKKNKKSGEENNAVENGEAEGKKKKKVKKPLDDSECQNGELVESTSTVDGIEDKPIIVSTGKKRRIEKKKAKRTLEKKPIEEMTPQELELYNKKKAKRLRQIEKRKMFKKLNKEAEKRYRELNGIDTNAPKDNGYPNNSNNNKWKNDRNGKVNDEHKRRKPNSQVKSIIVNGKEEELAYFDGFPIKKEEAARLSQLKKEMISKGLPKSQVDAALKLERRKAEKALVREKKITCFNCRQSGHNLSDCPNLDNPNNLQTAASGICYKCGSTEHTQFQCKVVKHQEFKFATCFICNEQGHLSRQCPDNARGIYPKGGACNICGDVTHLRRDCPTHVANQESNNISLNRMNGSNIEGLDDESKVAKPEVRRINKIVKFD